MLKTRKRKIITTILGIISAIILATGAYVYYLYSTAESVISSSYKPTERKTGFSQLRSENVEPIGDNVSVLFIGVDAREPDEQSRSDALLLATFNNEENSVKLLSIPRDTYMYIPEVDYSTKVNHAHAYGGPTATMETLENYFGVPIDYYVSLNFNAFIEVVDAIGGIEMDVPYEMEEMDSNDRKDAIHLEPGLQQLNGEEALALARTRKYDSDVNRGMRQQEIIAQIVAQSANVSSFLRLDELISAVGTNMTTNLNFKELTSFSNYVINTSVDIDMLNLEGDGNREPDGIWYYQGDEESRQEITEQLRNHLDLPPAAGDTLYKNTSSESEEQMQ